MARRPSKRFQTSNGKENMKKSLRALVIDDDPQVRAFVAEILRDDGWEISQAESAEQAFELSLEQEWSAVFCDIRLGGADGFSVLHRFKNRVWSL